MRKVISAHAVVFLSNVFLDESEFADVILVGATIGHTLDMSRSKVSGKLDLDSLS